MSADVLTAGPMSLIQTLGRENVAHQGLSQGGALDEHAFLWANKLLDNKPNSAQIEVNMGNLILHFTEKTNIAITGADMQPRINGQLIATWASHNIFPGDTLKLNGPKEGMRTYIAISDGWALAPNFGSLSTVPRESIGYIIKKEQRLPYKAALHKTNRRIDSQFIPRYQKPIQLNLIPGYQFNQFSDKAITTLTNQTYLLSNQCDRMGFRLTGTAVESPLGSFTSEGIALGALQIPADGQPIILLKDRQTIGGYPKPGCIARLDLNKLVQLKPGSQITFALSSLSQEIAKKAIFDRFLG